MRFVIPRSKHRHDDATDAQRGSSSQRRLHNSHRGEMGEDYSVLLFYHFTPLTDQAREVDWHRALCERLHLFGRLRVSPQGLNGTLSGSTAALGEYTRSVDARCPAEGQGIDFHWNGLPKQPFRYRGGWQGGSARSGSRSFWLR